MKITRFFDRFRDGAEGGALVRRHVRVTVRRWLLVAGAALLALAVAYDVWATEQNRQDTQLLLTYAQSQAKLELRVDHLTAEVKTAEQDHGTTLAEIQGLQQQVASVILGLPAADAYLGKLASGLESQIQSVCNAVHASCSDLPVSLPSGSSAASTTTTTAHVPPVTTTTTRPPHPTHGGQGTTHGPHGAGGKQ